MFKNGVLVAVDSSIGCCSIAEDHEEEEDDEDCLAPFLAANVWTHAA